MTEASLIRADKLALTKSAIEGTSGHACRIGCAAIAGLFDELALYPKPGLVSFEDAGSHVDMNADTFLRSLLALHEFFVEAAHCGANRAAFSRLEALGIDAERAMLKATQGVNTHRGAIFCLGILCGGAGFVLAQNEALTPRAVQEAILRLWGTALSARDKRPAAVAPTAFAGACGERQVVLRSAGVEAALGFPVLFTHALPALGAARNQGLSRDAALLQTLFTVIAELEDTTLVHRGGMEGLRFAQRQAREFLAAGGASRTDASAHGIEIHRAFVARRLSPGGAADILAAACWFDRLGSLR